MNAQAEAKMPEELHAKLVQLGWDESRISRMAWGRRIRGGPEGILFEDPNSPGREFHVGGPFTSVRVGDYAAIVRFG